MFYEFFAIACLLIAALGLALHFAWLLRAPFWRAACHHAHLIPPVPRSYRQAR